MKAGKIINVVTTYSNYNRKIGDCVKKQIEYDAWEDEQGVLEMQEQINTLNEELGKFLDTEV